MVLTPLYSRLFSQKAPDFRSENQEIFKAISMVSKQTDKKGAWVLDRGGDSRQIMDCFLDEELGFITRSKGKRHLIYRGRKDSVYNLALACPLPYMERVVREEGKRKKIYFLEFGLRPVKLPGREERLYLVVVRGFGQEPMMLLTSQRVKRSRKSIWRIIESYITRWRIEETLRFIKQSYNLEDIRLLTYRRLQNMMALVLAVTYFAMVYLGLKTKLRVLARHVLTAAKRLFGIPDFRFYALADGIQNLLFRHQKGIESFKNMINTQTSQLKLFDP